MLAASATAAGGSDVKSRWLTTTGATRSRTRAYNVAPSRTRTLRSFAAISQLPARTAVAINLSPSPHQTSRRMLLYLPDPVEPPCPLPSCPGRLHFAGKSRLTSPPLPSRRLHLSPRRLLRRRRAPA